MPPLSACGRGRAPGTGLLAQAGGGLQRSRAAAVALELWLVRGPMLLTAVAAGCCGAGLAQRTCGESGAAAGWQGLSEL